MDWARFLELNSWMNKCGNSKEGLARTYIASQLPQGGLRCRKTLRLICAAILLVSLAFPRALTRKHRVAACSVSRTPDPAISTFFARSGVTRSRSHHSQSVGFCSIRSRAATYQSQRRRRRRQSIDRGATDGHKQVLRDGGGGGSGRPRPLPK